MGFGEWWGNGEDFPRAARPTCSPGGCCSSWRTRPRSGTSCRTTAHPTMCWSSIPRPRASSVRGRANPIPKCGFFCFWFAFAPSPNHCNVMFWVMSCFARNWMVAAWHVWSSPRSSGLPQKGSPSFPPTRWGWGGGMGDEALGGGGGQAHTSQPISRQLHFQWPQKSGSFYFRCGWEIRCLHENPENDTPRVAENFEMYFFSRNISWNLSWKLSESSQAFQDFLLKSTQCSPEECGNSSVARDWIGTTKCIKFAWISGRLMTYDWSRKFASALDGEDWLRLRL